MTSVSSSSGSISNSFHNQLLIEQIIQEEEEWKTLAGVENIVCRDLNGSSSDLHSFQGYFKGQETNVYSISGGDSSLQPRNLPESIEKAITSYECLDLAYSPDPNFQILFGRQALLFKIRQLSIQFLTTYFEKQKKDPNTLLRFAWALQQVAQEGLINGLFMKCIKEGVRQLPERSLANEEMPPDYSLGAFLLQRVNYQGDGRDEWVPLALRAAARLNQPVEIKRIFDSCGLSSPSPVFTLYNPSEIVNDTLKRGCFSAADSLIHHDMPIEQVLSPDGKGALACLLEGIVNREEALVQGSTFEKSKEIIKNVASELISRWATLQGKVHSPRGPVHLAEWALLFSQDRAPCTTFLVHLVAVEMLKDRGCPASEKVMQFLHSNPTRYAYLLYIREQMSIQQFLSYLPSLYSRDNKIEIGYLNEKELKRVGYLVGKDASTFKRTWDQMITGDEPTGGFRKRLKGER